jgi:hypothetical protein
VVLTKEPSHNYNLPLLIRIRKVVRSSRVVVSNVLYNPIEFMFKRQGVESSCYVRMLDQIGMIEG